MCIKNSFYTSIAHKEQYAMHGEVVLIAMEANQQYERTMEEDWKSHQHYFLNPR